eukprot:9242145-Karenia_brevis.AAC.1
MLDKHIHVSDLVCQIYQKYQSVDFPGTNFSQDHLSTVEPTPVPGGQGRNQHKHALSSLGPIGLLLEHAH